MKKEHVIRRANLRALVNEKFQGNVGAHDAFMGWKGSRTAGSLLSSGARNIGTKVARQLEAAHHLEVGSFDTPWQSAALATRHAAQSPITIEGQIALRLQVYQTETGRLILLDQYVTLFRLCANCVELKKFEQPDTSENEAIDEFVLKHAQ